MTLPSSPSPSAVQMNVVPGRPAPPPPSPLARDRVCIVPHLGLGDMIVLNGLVRETCKDSEEVLLFVKKAYVSSIRSLFGDIKNLRLKFVDEAHELYAHQCRLMRDAVAQGFELVLLGQHSGSEDWKALDPVWSRALYRQAGMDPRDMHTQFNVARQPGREQAMLQHVRRCVGDIYVVVHDDPSRGFVVDRSHLPAGMPEVHVDDPRWRTSNIFDYAAVIDNAMQLHAFDSCFMLMADFMCLRARKFCHTYCKDPDMPAEFYMSDVAMIRSVKSV